MRKGHGWADRRNDRGAVSNGQNQGIPLPIARAYAATEAADPMVRKAAVLFDADIDQSDPRLYRRACPGSAALVLGSIVDPNSEDPAGFGANEDLIPFAPICDLDFDQAALHLEFQNLVALPFKALRNHSLGLPDIIARRDGGGRNARGQRQGRGDQGYGERQAGSIRHSHRGVCCVEDRAAGIGTPPHIRKEFRADWAPNASGNAIGARVRRVARGRTQRQGGGGRNALGKRDAYSGISQSTAAMGLVQKKVSESV